MISIEATPVIGDEESAGSGHLLLIFTHDDSREFVIRGSPTVVNPALGDGISGWGNLIIDNNVLLEDSDDAIRPGLGETVAERGNTPVPLGRRRPEDVWHILTQHADNIHAKQFRYLLSPRAVPGVGNSNSVIANLLYLIGFDREGIRDLLREVRPSFGTTFTYLGFQQELPFDYSISGTSSDDIIQGRGGRQTFFGGLGDDRLTVGRGDDILNGGGGVDTDYYKNPLRENLRLQYNIERAENGADFIVASAPTRGDRPPFDGTDTLTDIELLQFPDTTVDLTEYVRYSEQETIVNQSGKTVYKSD